MLGNKATDLRAKEASDNKAELERPPITLEAAYSKINQKNQFNLLKKRIDCKIVTRNDQVLLARMRSENFQGLRTYKHSHRLARIATSLVKKLL